MFYQYLAIMGLSIKLSFKVALLLVLPCQITELSMQETLFTQSHL